MFGRDVRHIAWHCGERDARSEGDDGASAYVSPGAIAKGALQRFLAGHGFGDGAQAEHRALCVHGHDLVEFGGQGGDSGEGGVGRDLCFAHIRAYT